MRHLDHVEWEVSYGKTTNLIVFPVPDVKCRLLECLDRLLRQRVLDLQNEKKAIRTTNLQDSWFLSLIPNSELLKYRCIERGASQPTL